MAECFELVLTKCCDNKRKLYLIIEFCIINNLVIFSGPDHGLRLCRSDLQKREIKNILDG